MRQLGTDCVAAMWPVLSQPHDDQLKQTEPDEVAASPARGSISLFSARDPPPPLPPGFAPPLPRLPRLPPLPRLSPRRPRPACPPTPMFAHVTVRLRMLQKGYTSCKVHCYTRFGSIGTLIRIWNSLPPARRRHTTGAATQPAPPAADEAERRAIGLGRLFDNNGLLSVDSWPRTGFQPRLLMGSGPAWPPAVLLSDAVSTRRDPPTATYRSTVSAQLRLHASPHEAGPASLHTARPYRSQPRAHGPVGPAEYRLHPTACVRRLHFWSGCHAPTRTEGVMPPIRRSRPAAHSRR